MFFRYSIRVKGLFAITRKIHMLLNWISKVMILGEFEILILAFCL
jgi:hypothetical protein